MKTSSKTRSTAARRASAPASSKTAKVVSAPADKRFALSGRDAIGIVTITDRIGGGKTRVKADMVDAVVRAASELMGGRPAPKPATRTAAPKAVAAKGSQAKGSQAKSSTSKSASGPQAKGSTSKSAKGPQVKGSQAKAPTPPRGSEARTEAMGSSGAAAGRAPAKPASGRGAVQPAAKAPAKKAAVQPAAKKAAAAPPKVAAGKSARQVAVQPSAPAAARRGPGRPSNAELSGQPVVEPKQSRARIPESIRPYGRRLESRRGDEPRASGERRFFEDERKWGYDIKVGDAAAGRLLFDRDGVWRLIPTDGRIVERGIATTVHSHPAAALLRVIHAWRRAVTGGYDAPVGIPTERTQAA